MQLIEIHALQSIPVSNLNRDEGGSPKETWFGGTRRARVSSQSWKYAIRTEFNDWIKSTTADYAGMNVHQSRKHLDKIVKELCKQGKKKKILELNEDEIKDVLKEHLFSGKKGIFNFAGGNEADKTVYALSEKETAKIVKCILDLCEKDKKGQPIKEETEFLELLFEGENGKLKKDKENNLFPKAALIAAADEIKGRKAIGVNTALFGRMMANIPAASVDASVSVAHALGINVLQAEADFFTAVDDLSTSGEDPDQEQDVGAGHLTYADYNTSIYYRYALLDVEELDKNLRKVLAGKEQDDNGSSINSSTEKREETVAEIAAKFVELFLTTLPVGNKNKHAGYARPDFSLIISGREQPLNLVNAFLDPLAVQRVTARYRSQNKQDKKSREVYDKETMSSAAETLLRWKHQVDKAYGSNEKEEDFIITTLDDDVNRIINNASLSESSEAKSSSKENNDTAGTRKAQITDLREADKQRAPVPSLISLAQIKSKVIQKQMNVPPEKKNTADDQVTENEPDAGDN